jgi:hypothetical protein
MARSNTVLKADVNQLTGIETEQLVDLTQVIDDGNEVGEIGIDDVELAELRAKEFAEAAQSIVEPKIEQKAAFDAQKYLKLPNTSARIRALAADGYTRSQTVKIFKEHFGRDILYQHVRNVLIQPVKRPTEVSTIVVAAPAPAPVEQTAAAAE